MSKFIIYAPSYNEKQGGVIVLHKLCDILNRTGHEALLWPSGLSSNSIFNIVITFWRWLARNGFKVSGRYISPIAKKQDINDSIVIYPEIISGNPLCAKRYVRWFLHRPGFHRKKSKFKAGDLYFYYQNAFNADAGGLVCGGQLTVVDYFSDIYTLRNTRLRIKDCYLIRKGRGRTDLPSLSDKWVIDDLSHEDMARAFNESNRCYIYDLHTMYSTYAALCGCIPIVVPEAGLSKEDWVHEKELRYGVAYGEGDVPSAIETRQLMIERLMRGEQDNVKYVKNFLEVIKMHF